MWNIATIRLLHTLRNIQKRNLSDYIPLSKTYITDFLGVRLTFQIFLLMTNSVKNDSYITQFIDHVMLLTNQCSAVNHMIRLTANQNTESDHTIRLTANESPELDHLIHLGANQSPVLDHMIRRTANGSPALPTWYTTLWSWQPMGSHYIKYLEMPTWPGSCSLCPPRADRRAVQWCWRERLVPFLSGRWRTCAGWWEMADSIRGTARDTGRSWSPNQSWNHNKT